CVHKTELWTVQIAVTSVVANAGSSRDPFLPYLDPRLYHSVPTAGSRKMDVQGVWPHGSHRSKCQTRLRQPRSKRSTWRLGCSPVRYNLRHERTSVEIGMPRVEIPVTWVQLEVGYTRIASTVRELAISPRRYVDSRRETANTWIAILAWLLD
ncbi:10906_t:CDS:2, partial [Acaulospora colombiana]